MLSDFAPQIVVFAIDSINSESDPMILSILENVLYKERVYA